MRKPCEICGKTDETLEVMCAYGDIVRICRQGHFEGTAIDPWIGVPVQFTGPLQLDSLRYYPEGWIERLKSRMVAGGEAPWEEYYRTSGILPA